MNYDFSIESSAEKIQNINTKRYFQEVYQTFVNGNYRSATVMLYSVLICDLVYKLQDLRDIYGDSTAKKILHDIEKIQNEKPDSGDWEKKLIEFIKERTSLLETEDILAVETLRKYRHLSAHPVLNNSDLLFSPNKETVQSLIRNILDGILINPPFFSNKIFEIMLQDLSDAKDKLTDQESLESYVKSRYIMRLKDNDFIKVFRSLWKIVFITDDVESQKNRNINYRVLKIFTAHDKTKCAQLIKGESNYYSNINKDVQIGTLILFLATFPQLYNQFESSLKLLIESKAKDNGDFLFVSWFLQPSLKEHLISILSKNLLELNENYFLYMLRICKENDCLSEFCDFAISHFGKSDSFSFCVSRHKTILLKVSDYFTLDQINTLLKYSDENYQIYTTTGMTYKLQSIVEKHEIEIDKELYKNIYK